MNFRLFLFLLYVIPGRSRDDILSHFPKNPQNSLIYDVDSNYTYQDGGVYHLNSEGEKKLRGYFAAIGGVIVGLFAVLGVIIA